MFAQLKILAPALGGLALVVGAAALPGVAFAGGPRGGGGYGGGGGHGGGGGGGGCCKPTPPCCKPDRPNYPGKPPINVPPIKITPPPIIIVPPNINVNVSARANAEAYASSNATASAFNNNTIVIGGGGGGGGYGTAGSTSYVNGLNVEGLAPIVNRVPFQASRTQIKTVVVRAVCIDDREIPHPASQVFPGQDVTEGYEGELFRCIAGTRLSVTWAEWLGRVAFDGGTVINCAKGEAFWHGRGGEVACRPQRPARDCNERSLLRRYGVGVKVFKMVRVETYTEWREEVIQQSSSHVSGIALDGGVGGLQF